MMDSQADRMKREATLPVSDGDVKETSAQRKRRKKSKKKTALSESEKKISNIICQALPDLIEQARELHHLDELQPYSNPANNNDIARAVSEFKGCGNLFQDLCCDFDDQNGKDHSDSLDGIFLHGVGDLLPLGASDFICRCVHNKNDYFMITSVDRHPFVIPPLSSFLTSSFHYLVSGGYRKIQVTDGFDLIVIDPPWNNKSVKRKKSYQMVQETDLKQIPIGDLAGRGCLICMWITNNNRLKGFVREELFPHWSVDFIAEWFWMKVTKKGEPVCDILSPHKKPYEQLIIGRFKKPLKVSEAELSGMNGIDVSPSAATFNSVVEEEKQNQQARVSGSIEQEELPCIPEDYVVVSVPCSLHSKKPTLSGILSEYLPADPCCLELFARNLTPGWVSWGNEPLRHQHLGYFEQTQQ